MVTSRGEGETGGKRGELAGAAEGMAVSRYPKTRISKSRLHNFSFPTMSWGSQRLLRCMNPVLGTGGSAAGSPSPEIRRDPQNGRFYSSSPDSPLPLPPTVSRSPKEMEAEEAVASSAAAAEAAAAATAVPWNLRTRRSGSCAAAENGLYRYPCSSTSHRQLGKDDPRTTEQGENGQRRKFSISLSPEEIEEDFYAFKGTKPRRRPKKRPRIVQRQLDTLFPGLWLSEITMDTYKIVE